MRLIERLMAAVPLARSATVPGISPKRKMKLIKNGRDAQADLGRITARDVGSSQGSDKVEGTHPTLGVKPSKGLTGTGKSRHGAEHQARGAGAWLKGGARLPPPAQADLGLVGTLH